MNGEILVGCGPDKLRFELLRAANFDLSLCRAKATNSSWAALEGTKMRIPLNELKGLNLLVPRLFLPDYASPRSAALSDNTDNHLYRAIRDNAAQ